MATLKKNDIWTKGTTQIKGYGTVRADRATRVGLVTNTTNANTDTQTAIDLMKTAVGNYHHNETSLPLHNIRAYKIAPKKLITVANFARAAGSIPTESADVLTSRSSGTQSIDWWLDNSIQDAQGAPGGELQFYPHSTTQAANPGELRPRPFRWRFGVTVFSMYTVLDAQPSATYTALTGKANANIVSQFLTTGSFPVNTLYFAGLRSTPVERHGTTRYVVRYQVVYNPYTWRHMMPPIFNVATQLWEVTTQEMYTLGTFSFTVHTPV